MKKIELTHGTHNICLLPQQTQQTHVARIFCNTCNTWLNWASKDMYRYWCSKNYKSMELSHFYEDFNRNGIKTPKPELVYVPRNELLVWLDVPYVEKENAKNHGAKWSPGHKKWYTHTGNTKIEELMQYVDVCDMADVYEYINSKGNNNPYYDK